MTLAGGEKPENYGQSTRTNHACSVEVPLYNKILG